MTENATPKQSQTRIESLDWLRGLMALSIMCYHLSFWYFYHPDASGFLGRMGIYGVSIFFVLSGLSMAVVYHRFINSINRAGAFFVRRFFRIWPLLIIATVATLLIKPDPTVHTKDLLLNLTGFFGFVPPFRYIATGAWSIGNEMFYYALTPLILMAYNYRRLAGNLLLGVALAISVYFAFIGLTPHQTLPDQWMTYIHPMNNLSLYVAGIAIYYNTKSVSFNQFAIVALFSVCLLAFIFYPVSGNQINIVTGWNRIAFMALSIGLVVSFYKFELPLTRLVSYPLEKLGLVTYGVYILHPVVRIVVGYLFKLVHFQNNQIIVVSIIVATIGISLLSYYFFEYHLIRLGKKLTS